MHHLLVYECHGKINDSLLYGPGFDCYATANMPLKDCYSYGVVAAWAVGGKVGVGFYKFNFSRKLRSYIKFDKRLLHVLFLTNQAFYYPPRVGYPVGTPDTPSAYMLELHYDNTAGIEG